MTSKALIVPAVDLKMNPPPYGKLHLPQGAWDQLQARKAYEESDAVPEAGRNPAFDRNA